jgi:hemoglobin
MPRSPPIRPPSPPKPPRTPSAPVTGKPVDPAITAEYEGRKWSFAKEACKTKWLKAREDSLYQKLGGKAAMEAAIDAFYVKVLADDRVKHFFDDVSMDKQRRKQKEFLSAAFGGPLPWTGKDMRKAHEGMGLTEVHFNAIAENLVNTLKDLKISQDLIDQVVAMSLSRQRTTCLVVRRRPTEKRPSLIGLK